MDTVGWGLVEGVGGIWELLFPPGLKAEGRGGKQLQRFFFHGHENQTDGFLSTLMGWAFCMLCSLHLICFFYFFCCWS